MLFRGTERMPFARLDGEDFSGDLFGRLDHDPRPAQLLEDLPEGRVAADIHPETLQRAQQRVARGVVDRGDRAAV